MLGWVTSTTLALAAACAITANARAADAASAPGAPLSLDEAIGFALKHQPQVLAAKARLRASRAAERIPGAAWRPTVGALAEVVAGSANNSTASVVSNGALDLPQLLDQLVLRYFSQHGLVRLLFQVVDLLAQLPALLRQ